MHFNPVTAVFTATAMVASILAASNDLQIFKQAIDDSDVVAASKALMSAGNCDIAGCIEIVESIIEPCATAISGSGEDIGDDLSCVSAVLEAFASSNGSNACVTCLQEGVVEIEKLLNQTLPSQ
ncbi:uncharacterized protein TRUGW13939_07859 [Talaromyces rugulosus]|uniref:Fungal calcium binding protein domain-containing protein n=1 Tax=Talaromyces rugulosus TaxID=121627 RepID=A0A7H8R791_TALRU|nr:uncharacterized protein TRUGW13939_07859 [Talaromyces rugulosus]QKX60713.1 hypothetical protein TRUGW13939_07859 [Talaromyces rugulosus]